MAEINSFKITYRLDATVQINGHSWAKPGVESSVSFDDLPTEEQLEMTSRYLMSEVVEPLLDDVIKKAVERTVEAEVQMGYKTKS